MKAMILALLTGLLMAAGLQSPASAYTAYNDLRHVTDNGYDAPILIRCADGRTVQVPEGANSNDPGGCANTVAIYTRGNLVTGLETEHVRCYAYPGGDWYTISYAPGWKNVGDWSKIRACVVQRPADVQA